MISLLLPLKSLAQNNGDKKCYELSTSEIDSIYSKAIDYQNMVEKYSVLEELYKKSEQENKVLNHENELLQKKVDNLQKDLSLEQERTKLQKELNQDLRDVMKKENSKSKWRELGRFGEGLVVGVAIVATIIAVK